MSGILQLNYSIFIKNVDGKFVKLTDQLPDERFNLRYELAGEVLEYINCRVVPLNGDMVEITFEELRHIQNQENQKITPDIKEITFEVIRTNFRSDKN